MSTKEWVRTGAQQTLRLLKLSPQQTSFTCKGDPPLAQEFFIVSILHPPSPPSNFSRLPFATNTLAVGFEATLSDNGYSYKPSF